jgi:hypothetical protein
MRSLILALLCLVPLAPSGCSQAGPSLPVDVAATLDVSRPEPLHLAHDVGRVLTGNRSSTASR